MQFLNPHLLWGLLALAIPILIHLFHFRRYKKVYFSNTRFLKEVKEIKQSASKLKHLLVLLCRLLAFMFLVFAFAQPYFSSEENKANKKVELVNLFVDNSFSMEASGGGVQLFEDAKAMALKTINSYPDYMRFRVMDQKLKGADLKILDKETATTRVQDMTLVGAVKDLGQVQRRLSSSHLDESSETWIFSDGQKNFFDDFEQVDSNKQVNLVLLESQNQPNVAIDSCWFANPLLLPGMTNELFVKIKNYGNEDARDVRLSLQYDGQNRPAGLINVKAGKSKLDTISLRLKNKGWQEATIKIDDFPIEFDNDFHISFKVQDNLDILHIGNKNAAYFKAALENNGYSKVVSQSPRQLVYSAFPKYQLIIIDGVKKISSGLTSELSKFVKEGGNVLFFPSEEADVSSYNSLFTALQVNKFNELKKQVQPVHFINKRAYVFKDVFENNRSQLSTPQVKLYFDLDRRTVAGKEVLMSFRNDRPFLLDYSKGAGHFYLCTAPLNKKYSDLLSQGSYLVPMLNKMALAGKRTLKPAYVINESEPIIIKGSMPANDQVFQLSGAIEMIPAIYSVQGKLYIDPKDQIESPGIYSLKLADSLYAKTAYNFNRKESNLQKYSGEEIRTLLPEQFVIHNMNNTDDVVHSQIGHNNKYPLWYYCVILTLVFLFLEKIILRFFKS